MATPITSLTGNDTFQTWFNTTNSIISRINGVTANNIAGSTGIGVTLSSAGIVTISNTGVVSFNGSTGSITFNAYVSSLNGATGALTGVTGVAAGTGISITGTTRPTITNTGVLTVNGSGGAISNVAKMDTAQTFTALQSFSAGITGALTINDVEYKGQLDGVTSNIVIGKNNLLNLTTGIAVNNVVIGYDSLKDATFASYNTAIGNNNFTKITEQSFNTFVGGNNFTVTPSTPSFGSNNVCVGYGNLNTNDGNVLIGAEYNTFVGNSIASTHSKSLLENSVMGYNALLNARTASSNSCFGRSAINSLTDGDNNVSIGAYSGKILGPTGFACSNNIFVGYRAGVNQLDNIGITFANNSIFIGARSLPLTGVTSSREIVIGNDTIGAGTNTTVLGSTFTNGTVIHGVLSAGLTADLITSSGTITPTRPISFVSGVNAISTITAPSIFATRSGQITLIPTGLWSTNTSGNIALATTAVVNKALIMTWDSQTAKWYPSY
jgi:hypothetical protein